MAGWFLVFLRTISINLHRLPLYMSILFDYFQKTIEIEGYNVGKREASPSWGK